MSKPVRPATVDDLDEICALIRELAEYEELSHEVVFSVDGKRIGVDKSGTGGIYSLPWKTAKLKKGTHHLLATLVDAAGRKAAAGRDVRVCK